MTFHPNHRRLSREGTSIVTRLKRGLSLAGALLGVLVLLVVLVPFALSTDLVKRQVSEQISAWTGRPVVVRGEPVVTVFPHFTVKLKDVAVEGAVPGGTPIITAESIKASIRLLPLMIGRVEVAEITLYRPEIALERASDGLANWNFDNGYVGALMTASEDLETGSLGRLIINDAHVRFTDATNGTDESFAGLDMTISWPGETRTFTASGTTVWRGEEVEGLLSVGTLPDLFRPGDTPVRLSLNSSRLSIQFDGRAALFSGPQASGKLTVTSPSLRRALTWAGADLTAGSTLGPLRLDGAVRIAGPLLEVTDARVELDGNSAEGTLALTFSGERPSLQGTLDGARFDLTPYVENLSATSTASQPSDWRFRAIEMPLAGLLDLDLRLATRKLILSDYSFDDIAGSLNLRGGDLSVTIGTARVMGGTMTAALTLSNLDTAPVSATLGIAARDISARAALTQIFGLTMVEGHAQSDINLTGTGETFADVMRSLSGTIALSMSDGTLNGIDVPALARILKRGDLTAITEALRGRTSVTSATAGFTVNNGVATTADARAIGDGVEIDLAGSSDLFGRTLGFTGRILLPGTPDTNQAPDSAGVLIVPFELGGTWSSPLLTPDLSTLAPR